MNERTRAYIYRVSLAGLGLFVARGLVMQDEAPLWAELLAAVAGVGSAGLAAKNTSTKRD